VTFSLKNLEYVIKISLSIFDFHISANFHTKKKTYHDIKIWMFSITLSPFESIAWIFFGNLWICDKVIWGCVYNLEDARENKMS